MKSSPRDLFKKRIFNNFLKVVENLNLANFEFSQNYFMFWDKLEKANYFFENIIF